MNIEGITFWAKNSVLGIILLGAIGSLFSLLLLKAFQLLYRKYQESVLLLLRPLIKRAVAGQIVGLKVVTEHKSNLQIYFINKVFWAVISTIFLAALVVPTIVYFVVWGFRASVGGIVLLSLSFAFGYMWIGDMFEYAGLCDFFINEDIKKLENAMDKEKDVDHLHQLLYKNCKRFVEAHKKSGTDGQR